MQACNEDMDITVDYNNHEEDKGVRRQTYGTMEYTSNYNVQQQLDYGNKTLQTQQTTQEPLHMSGVELGKTVVGASVTKINVASNSTTPTRRSKLQTSTIAENIQHAPLMSSYVAEQAEIGISGLGRTIQSQMERTMSLSAQFNRSVYSKQLKAALQTFLGNEGLQGQQPAFDVLQYEQVHFQGPTESQINQELEQQREINKQLGQAVADFQQAALKASEIYANNKPRIDLLMTNRLSDSQRLRGGLKKSDIRKDQITRTSWAGIFRRRPLSLRGLPIQLGRHSAQSFIIKLNVLAKIEVLVPLHAFRSAPGLFTAKVELQTLGNVGFARELLRAAPGPLYQSYVSQNPQLLVQSEAQVAVADLECPEHIAATFRGVNGADVDRLAAAICRATEPLLRLLQAAATRPGRLICYLVSSGGPSGSNMTPGTLNLKLFAKKTSDGPEVILSAENGTRYRVHNLINNPTVTFSQNERETTITGIENLVSLINEL